MNPTSRSPSPEPLTHVKEQEALRNETIAAFHTSIKTNDDEDEDDLLVPRDKTKDELEREEEEYKEFLRREVGENLDELITVEGAGEDSAAIKAEEGIKEKKRKNKKAGKSEKAEKGREEDDQEFLMK